MSALPLYFEGSTPGGTRGRESDDDDADGDGLNLGLMRVIRNS